MKRSFLLVLILLLLGISGCAKKLPFPDQATLPATAKLPIDGDWRLLTGNITSVFRIDRGRMYYYAKEKPPKGLRRETVNPLSSVVKSVTDYSRLPGNAIAMSIRETGDGTRYSCRVAVYDTQKRGLDFVPGEIRVSAGNRIALRALSKIGVDAVATVEDRFGRFGAEDIPTAKTASGRQVEAATRKATVIPPEKMEADGRLSDSAEDFIRQTITSSRAADGAVEIRYPPNTSAQIVKALQALGAEVSENPQKRDYELIIILIKPGNK